jgi:hypothetical protein
VHADQDLGGAVNVEPWVTGAGEHQPRDELA